MTLVTLLLAAALAVISIIAAVVARSQAKTAVTRFSRRFGLDVPPGMEGHIRAVVQARRIGATTGTLVAVSIATVFLLLFPGFQLLATWWCLFGSYLLGAGLGATVAIFISEGKRERGVMRVARSTAVTVADYVPPFQSFFGRFCVVVAVLALVGDCWLTVEDSAGYLSIVSGVLVVLSVITLIVYEVVSHRATGRGASAGTPLELAWDDALRSYALVNLSGLVALMALYSLVAYNALVSTSTGPMQPEAAYGIYVGLLPIAASVGIFALVAIMSSMSSRQHFLRRLWPGFANTTGREDVAAQSTTPPDIMGGR